MVGVETASAGEDTAFEMGAETPDVKAIGLGFVGIVALLPRICERYCWIAIDCAAGNAGRIA